MMNEEESKRGDCLKKIILFDGVCYFCDKSVQFIIKHDPASNFLFAYLQSEKGIQLKKDYHIPEEMDSIILIEGNRYHSKSAAALKIARELKGGWKLFYSFILIPRPIRDAAYDLIARNRIKWFGEKADCELPPPDVRKRFL